MNRPQKWVCVHGHFYQPPRENPWTGLIDRQPSAAPFHDWNQRINQECYRANTAVAVMGAGGKIAKLVNNFAHMSWNMGPTLLAWLERNDSLTYRAIINADRASRIRFGGHGSAMAQAYSHVIMPLASKRDKVTQVQWGIADFQHRFRRQPEGMWLPECAVDTQTLESLAAEGIGFTILAPHQAMSWRRTGASEWQTTPIDTGRAYRCPLPSGRQIDIFFYDGATSQSVAFERLLSDGARFAQRLTARGPLQADEDLQPPLCHIATDGESYGHHHRFGDMALAWTLGQIAAEESLRLTNYAEYRSRFAPLFEVKIVEDSSWSCTHGTLRWREDCGCNSGGRPGWRQTWRRPLRNALEWLRDQIDRTLQEVGSLLLKDPWRARNEYIQVVLAQSGNLHDHVWQQFLARHSAHELSAMERDQVHALMSAAHNAMAMFTSCGWFFDDVSGIETIQVMRYAARAAELLEQVGGGGAQVALQERMALVPSNVFAEGTGRDIWLRHVETARRSATHAGSLQVDTDVRAIDTELSQLFERFSSVYPNAIAATGELPTSMRVVAQSVLRTSAIAAFATAPLDVQRLQQVVARSKELNVGLDSPDVLAAAGAALTRQLQLCEQQAKQGTSRTSAGGGVVKALQDAVNTIESLKEHTAMIDLFVPRSIVYRLQTEFLSDWQRRADAGEDDAVQRAKYLIALATAFGLEVEGG
jgi:alpha-amylase/alpha-mannosidase (GH57 family)